MSPVQRCHLARAFFNIYTGGAKAPPPSPYVGPPPLKGFGPPSNVPFCLKMSDNHAEIAVDLVSIKLVLNLY